MHARVNSFVPPSFPLSRLPPSYLALPLLRPCAWHTRRLAEQDPDGIVELQGCCIDREGSSTLLPLLEPPLESRARVYTRRGEGEGGGRLGRGPADTHASPLSSVYAIRYRAVASWNTRSRVEEGLGGRCRGFVAARRTESSKFD